MSADSSLPARLSAQGAYSPREYTPGDYTLDDVIALNDELIALVRAGVGLERGLLSVRGDLSGRLQKLVDAVAQRLKRGESLAQAVSSPEVGLPPLYRAVVEAGLRGGNLAVALEQMSATTRRVAQLRRLVGASMTYPALVVIVACALMGFVGPVWGRVLQVSQVVHDVSLGATSTRILDTLQHAGWFLAALPVALLIGALLWWWATGRAVSAQPSNTARWFRWLPGLGAMLRDSAAATFCEVLALLVEHRVPLPRALSLAGCTSGDREMQRAAEALAGEIEQGRRTATDDARLRRIPALVRWILLTGAAGGRNATAIRSAAEGYRRRALQRVQWLRIAVPVLLVVVIGGGAVGLFTYCIFGPWTEFVQGITQSIGAR